MNPPAAGTPARSFHPLIVGALIRTLHFRQRVEEQRFHPLIVGALIRTKDAMGISWQVSNLGFHPLIVGALIRTWHEEEHKREGVTIVSIP